MTPGRWGKEHVIPLVRGGLPEKNRPRCPIRSSSRKTLREKAKTSRTLKKKQGGFPKKNAQHFPLVHGRLPEKNRPRCPIRSSSRKTLREQAKTSRALKKNKGGFPEKIAEKMHSVSPWYMEDFPRKKRRTPPPPPRRSVQSSSRRTVRKKS